MVKGSFAGGDGFLETPNPNKHSGWRTGFIVCGPWRIHSEMVIPNPKRFEWESTELTTDFNVSEVFDLPASHRRGRHCHRGWIPGHKIPDREA